MTEDLLKKEYKELVALARGESKQLKKKVVQFRDLTIIRLLEDIDIIVAVDSNASIGEKEHDFKKLSYEEVGISAIKPALMEVLACGARPLILADNLCVEMHPTGEKIISVIKKKLKECGLDYIHVTGSTEDNMKTTQTGIGVTVIGILYRHNSRLATTKDGDWVFCIGLPQNGIEKAYSEYDYNVCKIETVIKLNELNYIHEILPIGSKGARYEANELARCSNLIFIENKECGIDLSMSAGSSTSVLVSISPSEKDKLEGDIDCPIFYIGTMASNRNKDVKEKLKED